MLIMGDSSTGLSPLYVEKIFAIIQDLNRPGLTILLVEQNPDMALYIAPGLSPSSRCHRSPGHRPKSPS